MNEGGKKNNRDEGIRTAVKEWKNIGDEGIRTVLKKLKEKRRTKDLDTDEGIRTLVKE